jgi:hypothetical protein
VSVYSDAVRSFGVVKNETADRVTVAVPGVLMSKTKEQTVIINRMKPPTAIVNKKSNITLIHVVKKAVGIVDEGYCSLLIGSVGIDSTKTLNINSIRL